MMHIHATQKLLNTSRLNAPLHISQAEPGQLLHSWYSNVVATGFAGKLLVIYVHEPSLLTVVCRGKTVKGTWEEFKQRLHRLLEKYCFDPVFVQFEAALADEYVVSKTNSRSMLGNMNHMREQLEFMCEKFDRYEDIELGDLEENMMNWLYPDNSKRYGYTSPLEFWKRQGKIISV